MTNWQNESDKEPTKEPQKSATPVPVTIVAPTTAPGETRISQAIPVKEVPKTAWEVGVQLLQTQGISTALLLLIAFGVPKYVVPVIQAGYERMAESYERSMKVQIESTAAILKSLADEHGRDREEHGRDRDAFRDAARNSRP